MPSFKLIYVSWAVYVKKIDDSRLFSVNFNILVPESATTVYLMPSEMLKRFTVLLSNFVPALSSVDGNMGLFGESG